MEGGGGFFPVTPPTSLPFYGSSRTHAEANKSHGPNASVAKSQPQKTLTRKDAGRLLRWGISFLKREICRKGVFFFRAESRRLYYTLGKEGIDNWTPDLAGEDLP